jgi:hypothetical protein
MSTPFDIDLFLNGVITGSKATRLRHIRQAKIIQVAISHRWKKENPWSWKNKHLMWFLKEHSKKSAHTNYYYTLTIKLIILKLEKNWKLHPPKQKKNNLGRNF